MENKKEHILEKYFIPPKTMQFMRWGQALMIFVLFGFMFIAILFSYIYSNYTDYQNRISVITNAYLFGQDPELSFKQYMRNSQKEIISSVMNDIQSSTMNIGTVNARLDSTASRLSNKVQTDVPDRYAESNSLGISIQKNIAQLRDTISKLAGSFVLGNYIKDGAINTVKS
jgi:predicted PurR-regulated permease PerM